MPQAQAQSCFQPLHAGPMDDAHREFLALLQALLTADDASEATCLARVLSQCRGHFADEERWMRESALPGAEAHTRDHASALLRLEKAQAAVEQGERGAGRVLGEELLHWFQQHSLTLDAALAFNLQRSRARRPGLSAVG